MDVSRLSSSASQGAQRDSFRRRLPSEGGFWNSMFFIAELGIKKRVVNKNGNYWSGTVGGRVSQVENVNIKAGRVGGKIWNSFKSLQRNLWISNRQGHVEDFKLLGKDLLRNFSFISFGVRIFVEWFEMKVLGIKFVFRLERHLFNGNRQFHSVFRLNFQGSLKIINPQQINEKCFAQKLR